uniref:Uncharacterized protein n=1 Tax=Rhizophora mucronata TaxID=61149 RepID=A0A2P2QGG2_RHIMU
MMPDDQTKNLATKIYILDMPKIITSEVEFLVHLTGKFTA